MEKLNFSKREKKKKLFAYVKYKKTSTLAQFLYRYLNNLINSLIKSHQKSEHKQNLKKKNHVTELTELSRA